MLTESTSFSITTSYNFTLMSLIELLQSTLGGPECLRGPAGEAVNESRFFADSTNPFSRVPPFSKPTSIGELVVLRGSAKTDLWNGEPKKVVEILNCTHPALELKIMPMEY